MFVAAVLAAGMTTIAARADAPANWGADVPPEKTANKGVTHTPRRETGYTADLQSAPMNAVRREAASAEPKGKAEKEQVKAAEGVDPIKTSATPSRTKPVAKAKTGKTKVDIEKGKTEVVSKARKSVKGAGGADVVAAAGGGSYGSIVSRYASAYGIPASLAHAVITVESNYRVNARGSAGEIGLMQIKPATARGMGYSGSAKGLFNPETNIQYGMKYLAKAHELAGGDTCGTILRYNAGHGARRMNPVSAAYCSKVKRQIGG
jgi:soluble lytic murein transglycosylase-like protein